MFVILSDLAFLAHKQNQSLIFWHLRAFFSFLHLFIQSFILYKRLQTLTHVYLITVRSEFLAILHSVILKMVRKFTVYSALHGCSNLLVLTGDAEWLTFECLFGDGDTITARPSEHTGRWGWLARRCVWSSGSSPQHAVATVAHSDPTCER